MVRRFLETLDGRVAEHEEENYHTNIYNDLIEVNYVRTYSN